MSTERKTSTTLVGNGVTIESRKEKTIAMPKYEYNGNIITIRETDGFIDATAMCKAGGKKFAHWHPTASATQLINALKDEVKQDVIKTLKGRSSKFRQGTWIHPRLATSLAQWISPLFALKVSEWIEEWRMLQNNNQKYIEALQNLEPSPNVQIERKIQEKLQKELGGIIEEKTPAGSIDLLTDRFIIEIKEISNWNQGMGQLLSYSMFHPTKTKRLHLFGSNENIDKNVIKSVCTNYDIVVTYETISETVNTSAGEPAEQPEAPAWSVQITGEGRVLASFDTRNMTEEQRRAFVAACMRLYVRTTRSRRVVWVLFQRFLIEQLRVAKNAFRVPDWKDAARAVAAERSLDLVLRQPSKAIAAA